MMGMMMVKGSKGKGGMSMGMRRLKTAKSGKGGMGMGMMMMGGDVCKEPKKGMAPPAKKKKQKDSLPVNTNSTDISEDETRKYRRFYY